MSSATTSTGAATASAVLSAFTVNTGPSTTTTTTQTYWCHECDMSFTLILTSPLLIICPHCNGDFCEEMDSFSPSPNPNPNPNFASLPPPLHPILSPTTDEDDLDSSFQIPSTIRLSDAYLLDRLIQHLTDPDDDTGIHHHHGSTPTAKSCVESIPTVKITTLSNDTSLCAVCKDEFVVNVEVKQLPCNHMYHFDCILPWLEMHNSCPVCRFLLPAEERRGGEEVARVGAVRFGNLMDEEDEEGQEEEDMFGVGSTLRHIVRRHRLVFPSRLGSSSSPTQMAQAETSSAGPANSGETVSSRAVEVGSRLGGSGRLDEDGDTVMSEVRQAFD